MYHPSDTAMVTVKSGIPGWAEKTPLPATPSGKAIKDGGCMAYDAATELIFASKGNKTGDFYAYDAAARRRPGPTRRASRWARKASRSTKAR